MVKYLKSALIGIVIFFGSGFSIMAFHNDIGIVDLFAQIYTQVIGYAPEQMGGLEVGYSIGLALGILIFFNHISLKKRENDPTPLQVEVSKYEQDVEDTIERIRQKEEKIQGRNAQQKGQKVQGQNARQKGQQQSVQWNGQAKEEQMKQGKQPEISVPEESEREKSQKTNTPEKKS